MSLRRALLPILTLAFAALGAACGPDYERLEIQGIVEPSGYSGQVSRSRIVVPHGMIVKANIRALNDDLDPMPLRMRPLDTAILGIEPVVSEHDYAFLGLRPGTTDVEVFADGERVLVIEAIVTAQAEVP